MNDTISTPSSGGARPPAGVAPESGGARTPAAHISRLAAWALAFGCAVGWGSFVMPGTTFLPKAGPLGTVIGVILGGLVMAVYAWSYHAMMNRNPGPGGAYTYATQAFGIDHGFLCAWFLVLAYVAIVWANATALAVVAHYVFGDIFKFGFHYHVAGFDVWMGDILLAAVAIIVASEICCRRRLAGGIQTILAVGLGLGILVCYASACFKHTGGLAATAPAFSNIDDGVSPIGQVLRIVALAPWLFVGFESISHSSGEFKFPLKRSFGVLAAALVASLLAYAMLAVLPALVPIEGTAGWSDYIGHLGEKSGDLALPTFAAVKRALGRTGVILMGLTMFCAIFTGLVGNIFAASRLLAAMADDGILPARFGRRNSDGSPQGAILSIAEVSILLPFLGRTAIGFIVDVSTIGAAIAYAYTSAAAWKLARGYLSRVVGILGLVLSAIILVLFIFPNYASGTMMATESYLILVLWCILGFVLFRDIFRHDERRRFGKSTVVWVALLILITFMSLMWMRQMTGDTTRHAIEDIERIHDEVFPDSTRAEDSAWDASLKEEQHIISVALTRGSLVQTGLMFVAFVILFNLYTILRQRERDSERDKMKARSYFFSTVSHDIRTPLNAIVGFSEMLKAGFKTEEERNQAIDSILVSSRTLMALVNDVLDLSRLESGRMSIKPVPIDCAKTLDEVFEVFKTANKNPNLDMRLKVGKMPLLMLDPQRLRQVTFNMLGNAVKFTEKGYVEVRANFKPDEGERTGTLILEIEDTGCGIPKEDLESITSAYVQTSAKMTRNGGTGLGLAICRQLAESVGGNLNIKSEVGEGSTFTITLPEVGTGGEAAPPPPPAGGSAQDREGLAPPCAPSGRAAPLPAAVRASGGARPQVGVAPESGGAPLLRRILLVDDSKMNLMVLKALLKRSGNFEVITAMDGNEALAALKAPDAKPFDLVLTDMWMPNMDGEGLVKAIRADPALASLKVVVVTADVELQGKSSGMGFDGILLKPVTSATLAPVLPEGQK